THYAVKHPQSLVGRVMGGANHAAKMLNPITGFGPTLMALKKQEAEAAGEVVGVPDEPVPAEESVAAANDEPHVGAAVVIPEDDRPVPVCLNELQPACKPAFAEGTECPHGDVCRAPAVMPFCQDEEQCETLPEPQTEECEEPKP